MINDIATTKKIAAPAHRSTFSTPTLGGVVKFNCCARVERDRKSTCLNSSHDQISYAVFCLKKKKSAMAAAKTASSTNTAIIQQHLSTASSRRSIWSNALMMENQTMSSTSTAQTPSTRFTG